MAFELSKQEIVKEIVKSGKDPIYFINTYCRISHPQRGLIKFDTYPYQDDLLEDFNDFRFTVILKARQLGISTITAAYIVWLINFHRDKNVMVLATKFATAANLVKKVKNVMKNLPSALMPPMLNTWVACTKERTREVDCTITLGSSAFLSVTEFPVIALYSL